MEQSNTCITKEIVFRDLLERAGVRNLKDLVDLFNLRTIVYDSEIDSTIDVQAIDLEDGALIFVI